MHDILKNKTKNKKKGKGDTFIEIPQETSQKHIPVMLSEVLSFLNPQEN